MTHKRNRIAAVLLASTAAFAAHAQDDAVTIVLSEELDVVEPCMASRSNIGRVILQNISETVTELVPGEGLQPRLAESWEDQGGGTWRFNLRQGVTFTDGSAFDAELTWPTPSPVQPATPSSARSVRSTSAAWN